MYRELIAGLAADNEFVKLRQPCPESELERAEKIVGYPFPEELKTLLRETDGDSWCLLSVKAMIENVETNRDIWLPMFEEDFSREEYIDKVDRFIFFATNGCGDYYGYRVGEDGVAEGTDVYIWEHEYLGEKCWKKVAGSLEEFIIRYYNSEI